MMKTIFFDLDGTLLDMELQDYVQRYFSSLLAYMASCGYDPELLEKLLWMGMEVMKKNDGTATNEEKFWQMISENIEDINPLKEQMKVYYENIYPTIGNDLKPLQTLIDYVSSLQGRADLVLATNPLFPKEATLARIQWAGMKPEWFRYITTYDNSNFSKPNPEYYKELLHKLDLKPDDVLMIGNDLHEDGAAQEAGIPVFILNRHLLHPELSDAMQVRIGEEADLMERIESFLNYA